MKGDRGTGTAFRFAHEDDDWFFTFYQPYRYILDHVPVYPSVGNHAASDEERSDDRFQLSDTVFVAQRFPEGVGSKPSSLDPGLIYAFGFGRDMEFVEVDTSKASEFEESRFCNHLEYVRFLGGSPPGPLRKAGPGTLQAWAND